MPNTYPRDELRPSANPLQNRNKARISTPLTSLSSRYLHPVQEQRILSWRAATPVVPPTPPPPTSNSNIKSAPASVALSNGAASEQTRTSSRLKSSCNCTCTYKKGKKSTCSCSTTTGVGEPITPSTPAIRSYYSSKKKQCKPNINSLPIEPLYTKRHTNATPTQNQNQNSNGNGNQNPRQNQRPDKKGLPSAAQKQSYRNGIFPAQQGEIPRNLPPDQMQAAPQVQPDLPRIAGARDPVSQQYWKGMFPPAGGPAGINPGLPFVPVHPAQMLGIGVHRPWGY